MYVHSLQVASGDKGFSFNSDYLAQFSADTVLPDGTVWPLAGLVGASEKLSSLAALPKCAPGPVERTEIVRARSLLALGIASLGKPVGGSLAAAPASSSAAAPVSGDDLRRASELMVAAAERSGYSLSTNTSGPGASSGSGSGSALSLRCFTLAARIVGATLDFSVAGAKPEAVCPAFEAAMGKVPEALHELADSVRLSWAALSANPGSLPLGQVLVGVPRLLRDAAAVIALLSQCVPALAAAHDVVPSSAARLLKKKEAGPWNASLSSILAAQAAVRAAAETIAAAMRGLGDWKQGTLTYAKPSAGDAVSHLPEAMRSLAAASMTAALDDIVLSWSDVARLHTMVSLPKLIAP